MGNSQTVEEAEAVGYRVLGVQDDSPASNIGLVSFFDFIIAANSIPLRSLDFTFMEIIKNFEDRPLILTIYNCKSKSIREVIVKPSKNWPGEGMLGVTIRFDSFHECEDHVIHILDVEPDSAAELAGLQPNDDYLLGTAEKVFKDTEILFEELSKNLEKPVEFYVYNSQTDEVRVTVLMPTDQWGGEGILGASVAHGYLHRIPSECCQTNGKTCISSSTGISTNVGIEDIVNDTNTIIESSSKDETVGKEEESNENNKKIVGDSNIIMSTMLGY